MPSSCSTSGKFGTVKLNGCRLYIVVYEKPLNLVINEEIIVGKPQDLPVFIPLR